MTSQKVLLTGATGFIGSHVAEHLLRGGIHPRCLVRPGRKGASWIEGLPLELVPVDTSDSRALDASLDGVGVVIHLAGVTKAIRSSDYAKWNVDMTRAVLEAAARNQVDRFLFVSSLTVVGPSPDGMPLTEEAACVPITPYGVSKLEAEKLVRSFSDRLGTTILRPPAVYGPRDRDTFEMFRWVSYGIKPRIGSGERSLSLIHVRDLARGIVDAATHPNTRGQTYFISDPKPYPFDTLIDQIARVMLKRPIPVPLPAPLLYALAAVVEGISSVLRKPAILNIDKARDMLQPHWVCDPSRLRKDTGFTTEVDIAAGLKETYDWYRAQGWLR